MQMKSYLKYQPWHGSEMLSIKHEVLHHLSKWIQYLCAFDANEAWQTSAASYLKIFSTTTFVFFRRHSRDIGFYNIIAYYRPSIFVLIWLSSTDLKGKVVLNRK